MADLWSVYILFLKDDHVYVGNTSQQSLEARLQKHFKGEGAEWTKIHKPELTMKPIIFYDILTKEKAMELESNLTFKYMKNYGPDNVRGHVYSRIRLTDDEYSTILKHFAHDESLCFNCLKPGHYLNACPKKGE